MKKILAIAAATVLILLGVATAVAYRAGERFESSMLQAQETRVSLSAPRLSQVLVHRGLFSSTATARLEIPGLSGPLMLPLEFQASQGLAPDGSALRVRVRMDMKADSPLRALASALNQPQGSFEARMRFGLGGNLDRMALDLLPIHLQAQSGLQRVDWDGAQMRMENRGAYRDGASSSGTVHWAPLSFSTAAPVNLQGEIGAMTERFTWQGRTTNASSTTELSSEPSVLDGAAGQVRIDRLHLRATTASNRDEGSHPDNPSGIPPGRSAIKDLDVTMTLSKPFQGRIAAKGALDMPVPDAALLQHAAAPASDGGADAEAHAWNRELDRATLALLRGTRGSVDLRISKTLLAALPAPVLQAILRQGYLAEQQDDLVGRVLFEGGRITLNDQVLLS